MSANDDADDGSGAGDERVDAGILLSERETEEGLLVAVCDADLLGETFEDGRVSLTVNEEFYGGEAASEDAVIASLKRAKTANLVGEHAIETAVEAGVIDPGAVLDVDGTRHAQMVRI